MNFAYYANLAMASAVVVYLVAFFAHAAEWAVARKVEPTGTGVRELALVGAASTSTQPSEEIGRRPPGARGPLTASERVEFFGRMGVVLTVAGFLLAVAGVVFRGLAAGRAPWGNMFEFTTAALVFVVAVYLVLVARFGMRWLGLPVTMLAAVGNGLAITVFYVAVAPLVPALHSVWFLIHIVAAAIAGAAFNVGGLASILYLIKHHAETKAAASGVPVTGYLTRLPSSRSVDVLAYRCLAFAFPVWTFTIAAGAVWAEFAWGRFWGWDPKETWALVTWVIYAGYLHARATAGWKGSRAAVIAIVGLVSFWFNFIGINLLVSGLHSYAGI